MLAPRRSGISAFVIVAPTFLPVNSGITVYKFTIPCTAVLPLFETMLLGNTVSNKPLSTGERSLNFFFFFDCSRWDWVTCLTKVEVWGLRVDLRHWDWSVKCLHDGGVPPYVYISRNRDLRLEVYASYLDFHFFWQVIHHPHRHRHCSHSHMQWRGEIKVCRYQTSSVYD